MSKRLKMDGRPIIEDVPEEVMIEIFGFLSPKLLKVCALVNKRWNQIISQSPKTLKHYQLNLVPSPLNKIQEAVSIGRKLTGLKTCALSEHVVRFMTSQNLKHLELHDMTIEKKKVAEILALVTNATSLVFHKVKLEESSRDVKLPAVKFLRLKRLMISSSDTRILSLVDTTSLTEFSSVRDAFFSRDEENINSDEVDLLVQQKLLTSLHLERSFDDFFQARVQDFTFELKKLRILYGDPTNVDLFVFIQQNHLEELKIWTQNRAPFALTFDMPKLKSLTVPRIVLPVQTPVLTELEHVSADFVSAHPVELAHLLGLSQQWTFFETEGLTGIPYKFFLVNLSKLERVGIPTNEKIDEGFLKNIKELKFTRVWDDEDAFNINIFNQRETLEKLTIDLIDDTKFSRGMTIDVIKFCKKLKFLSVGCSTTLVPHMLRKVKFDHPWTLEICFRKEENSPVTTRSFVDESKWQKLVFKFPDDEALFKGDFTTWDDNLIRELKSHKDFGLNEYINQFK